MMIGRLQLPPFVAGEICQHVIQAVDQAESEDEISKIISDCGDRLANNLLARNALAKKPIDQCRNRSVFDFAYPSNLYLSQFCDPITHSLSHSGTPLLDSLDPLTHMRFHLQ